MGKDDLLIPVSNAYKFQKDLQNNKLVILDHVGHVPMEVRTTESLDAVIKFIKNGT